MYIYEESLHFQQGLGTVWVVCAEGTSAGIEARPDVLVPR